MMMVGCDDIISIHRRAVITGAAEAFSIHETVVAMMAMQSRRASVAAAAGNFSIFASTFDALVGVLVQRCKVLPELLVGHGHGITFSNGGKSMGEILQRLRMKLVLM